MVIVVYQVVGAEIGIYHSSLVIGGKKTHRLSGGLVQNYGQHSFTYYWNNGYLIGFNHD